MKLIEFETTGALVCACVERPHGRSTQINDLDPVVQFMYSICIRVSTAAHSCTKLSHAVLSSRIPPDASQRIVRVQSGVYINYKKTNFPSVHFGYMRAVSVYVAICLCGFFVRNAKLMAAVFKNVLDDLVTMDGMGQVSRSSLRCRVVTSRQLSLPSVFTRRQSPSHRT